MLSAVRQVGKRRDNRRVSNTEIVIPTTTYLRTYPYLPTYSTKCLPQTINHRFAASHTVSHTPNLFAWLQDTPIRYYFYCSVSPLQQRLGLQLGLLSVIPRILVFGTKLSLHDMCPCLPCEESSPHPVLIVELYGLSIRAAPV